MAPLSAKQVRDQLYAALLTVPGQKRVYRTAPKEPLRPSLVLRPGVPSAEPGKAFGDGIRCRYFTVLVLPHGQLVPEAAVDAIDELTDAVHTALHGLTVGTGYAQVTRTTSNEIPVGAALLTAGEVTVKVLA